MADTDEATLAPPPLRDEDGAVRRDFTDMIAAAIEAGDTARLRVLVGDLHEADQGALIEAIDHDDRPRLIELLGGSFDFTALTEVDDAVREDILEELETETVAEGMRDLESDDAVALLEGLDAADQAEILEALSPIDRAAIRRSLDFAEDSAGRLMRDEFIAVPAFWTVGQVIDHMRESTDLPDSFFEVFVVDPGHRLLGQIFLDQLVRTKRPVAVEAIMAADRRRVRVDEAEEDVARLFERYNLVSAPVVDAGDRLVGVITIDDIVDVIQEEADEDIKALGGVRGEEELSDTVLDIARGRFGWLFINLLTAFLASSVLKGFAAELERMVALAVLAPVVASQGGNAATQTMTVTVRALATQQLGPWNAARIVLKEVWVGLLNGAGFAVITGIIASLWFGQTGLGIVIGLAMIVNLLAAALGGILIPLSLDRLGADPAVSSGPFVTTVTDVVGFFSFLGIATLWFGLG